MTRLFEKVKTQKRVFLAFHCRALVFYVVDISWYVMLFFFNDVNSVAINKGIFLVAFFLCIL